MAPRAAPRALPARAVDLRPAVSSPRRRCACGRDARGASRSLRDARARSARARLRTSSTAPMSLGADGRARAADCGTLDVAPTARAITAPTLVVTGEPRARSRRAGRRLGSATCRLIAGARARLSSSAPDISAAITRPAGVRRDRATSFVGRYGRSAMPLREMPGPAGRLEALLEEPRPPGTIGHDGRVSAGHPDGLRAAVVFAHPHTADGGTMHTKVVYQAAKALQPDRLRGAALQLPRRRRERRHVRRRPRRAGRLPRRARLHGSAVSRRAALGRAACRSARGSR